MNFNITMIARNDFLCAPPFGNLGVIVSKNRPDIKVGEHITISCLGAEIVKGVVTAIEGRDSCIRQDIPPGDRQKYKIHWIPFDPQVTGEMNYKLKQLDRIASIKPNKIKGKKNANIRGVRRK